MNPARSTEASADASEAPHDHAAQGGAGASSRLTSTPTDIETIAADEADTETLPG